ncbi:DmsE family decaheme c-type cytochrome [Rhodoferax sp. GW822-FHT02A01]|uniref:DmsE family decaheme c-type cytochrome n=1 Tax=Rhodoferax sp. GW822-FHT02A01 TaxID=3141537 RepID=UPI00315C5DF2
MKLMRRLMTWCVAAGVVLCVSSVQAADEPQDLVLKGDAACTACHDESDAPELLAIGKTRHGTVADTRPPNPIGKTRHGTQTDIRTPTCTSCHGASEAHLDYKGSGKRPHPDVVYGGKTPSSAQVRNETCQECHSHDSKRDHWDGSVHQTRDVTCSACHKAHVAKDPVRDKRMQSETCFACHKAQRTQLNKPSHHPLVEGKMSCSDCHNPHGSAGPSLMKRDSVVDTCYACHMEKRGPFVHSHQPVDENCGNCHEAHGTTAPSLLKSRPPFLCQTCHTTHGAIQPSVASGSVGNPGWWNGAAITQGRGCLNCHTQVHGSNNPASAGQRLFR